MHFLESCTESRVEWLGVRLGVGGISIGSQHEDGNSGIQRDVSGLFSGYSTMDMEDVLV